MCEVFKPLFAVHVLYVQQQKLDADYQRPIPADHLWEAVTVHFVRDPTEQRGDIQTDMVVISRALFHLLQTVATQLKSPESFTT